MATEKVFVLLSGGVDSSSALALAKNDFPGAEFEAVSIDYGQRHARELQAAREIAEHFQAEHVIIDTKGFMEGMLVDKGEDNEKVPDVSYAELPAGISPTYVTFRNGLMLSIVAARAQAWVMQQQKEWNQEISDQGENQNDHEMPDFDAYIYLGIHADDGANWAYPDCTQEFIGPMSAAIYVGTYNRVRVRAPFTFMNKAMLTGIGLSMGVPFEKTWSCYKGEELHCGTCPTCQSRKEAFRVLRQSMGPRATDPTKYAA